MMGKHDKISGGSQMKKTMLCAAVLALSVAATGCASGKKAESSAASTESKASETKAQESKTQSTTKASENPVVSNDGPVGNNNVPTTEADVISGGPGT